MSLKPPLNCVLVDHVNNRIAIHPAVKVTSVIGDFDYGSDIRCAGNVAPKWARPSQRESPMNWYRLCLMLRWPAINWRNRVLPDKETEL